MSSIAENLGRVARANRERGGEISAVLPQQPLCFIVFLLALHADEEHVQQ